jgi:competence protein ComEC
MPIVYFSISFLLGIALAGVMNVAWPWWLWALACAATVMVFALWRRERFGRIGFVCGVLFLLGVARHQNQPCVTHDELASYREGAPVALQGIVIAPPDVRDRATDVRVAVVQVRERDERVWKDTSGVVLARLERFENITYGTPIELYGVLRTPPALADFSYREYLARQGVHSLMERARPTRLPTNSVKLTGWDTWCTTYIQGFDLLFALRDRSQAIIMQSLPDPQASLLAGILLGIERTIPVDTLTAFNLTGTSHLIAISGYNITIIAGFLASLGSWFVRRRHAWLIVVMGITAYVIFVGASASVVRAGIMGILYVWAQAVGRRSAALATLALSAAVMALWSPNVVWDVGFQLSFVATLGLVVMATPLTQWFEQRVIARATHPLATYLLKSISANLWVTVAATLITQPLIVYYFHRLSLISLFVNLLTLPVQPAVMGAGLLVIVGGFITSALGQFTGWLVWPFLTWTIVIIESAARLPFASIETGRLSLILVFAYYLILAALVAYCVQPPARRATIRNAALPTARQWQSVSLMSACVLVGMWFLGVTFSLPDGRLQVSFLDVGQGDATLIKTPSGQIIVIDGGPSPTSMSAALGRALPFYQRDLALIVLTRASDEKLTGLVPLLDRYTIQQIVAPELTRNHATVRQWRERISEKAIPTRTAFAGLQIDLGDEALLEIEQVGKEDEGITLRLRYGAFNVYFDGDGETLAKPYDSALLWKVARQGDAKAARAEVLQTLAPQFAVISVDSNHHNGTPNAQTLARLSEAGLAIYRTDEHGTLTFRSDGKQVWVELGR